MAEEEKVVTSEDQSDEQQEEAKERFYTAEEVEQLLDKRAADLNARFQKKFAELKTEKEEVSTEKMSIEERFQELEKQFDEQRKMTRRETLKQSVLETAAKAGHTLGEDELDIAYSLIDESSEDPLNKVAKYINQLASVRKEGEMDGRKSFAKENGRKVTGTEQPDNNLDYAKLNRLSDEELKSIPADVRRAIAEAALKK